MILMMSFGAFLRNTSFDKPSHSALTPTHSREACTSIVTKDAPFVSSHLMLSESNRTILVGALFLYSLRAGC